MTDTSSHPALPASTIGEAVDLQAAMTIDDAALRAGCTPAYLRECIAFGQLSPPNDAGLIEAGALTAWLQEALQPQQRALRAIVDAIDTMEQRSLKPVADAGPAVPAPGTPEPITAASAE